MLAHNHAKAIQLFNQALVTYREEEGTQMLADMLTALGDVYNEDRQFLLSDSCYQAALELDPANATALNNYSYYLSERGEKLDEAKAMSARSLTLRPEEPTFLDTYGWILYKQGQYKEAKEYIQRAIEGSKEGSDATLWDHMGDIELKLGNVDEAVQHWKQAVQKGAPAQQIQLKIKQQKEND